MSGLLSGLMPVVRARTAQLQLALMLLTRLPIGRIDDPVPPMAAASWAFPLAGAVIGGITAAILFAAMRLGLPPTIAAGLALATGVVATGGLHEDGLADVADGFGGGRDRDRKLAIMRDSRIGSYGALALLLVVGLRWQAMAALAGTNATQAALAMLAIAVASRATLPVVLMVLPAARPDGLGHAAGRPAAIQAAVAVALGVGGVVLLLGAPAALAVVLAICAAVLLVAVLAMRQIGGQTVDVLGAIQQAADLSGWIALVWLLL